ncbi:molybdenum cofactor guanylyltransferase MobA [Xanthobacteraceae bacterium A53D]
MTHPRPPPPCPLTGLILAGGLGRRMGGVDKALVDLAGRPLLSHVLDRLAPQVDQILLSANGPPERFAAFGLKVMPDTLPDHPGPLAGVLAGMEALAGHLPDHALLLSVPADAPLIPADLAARLLAARQAAGSVMAHATSGGRDHPVVALWPLGLRHVLRAYLEAGERRVYGFIRQQGSTPTDWACAGYDPFQNVNTPEDVAHAAVAVRR